MITGLVGYYLKMVIIYKFYVFTCYNMLKYVYIHCYVSLQCFYTVNNVVMLVFVFTGAAGTGTTFPWLYYIWVIGCVHVNIV